MRLIVLVMSIFLASCSGFKTADKIDPFEPINRGVHRVNNALHSLYIDPVSNFYNLIVPRVIAKSVGDFIYNVGEVPSFANLLLQGKGNDAITTSWRFVINSTIGMLGLFDIATELGIERKREDFGQTLAVWGWKESSYLVLPLLGPSTIRDTVGLVGNTLMYPPYYLKPKYRNPYYTLTLIDKKANLREFEKVANTAGVEDYSLIRNSYIQHRNFLISDGKPVDPVDTDSIKSVDLGEPPA